MTIPEAIEILKEIPTDGYDPHDPVQYNAIKLGIEALKRHKLRRQVGYRDDRLSLPGETED